MVLEFSTKALVNLLERKLWNEKGPKRTSKVFCAWCVKLADAPFDENGQHCRRLEPAHCDEPNARILLAKT